jgi:enoyl-CoA hydratase/carnithine racemase
MERQLPEALDLISRARRAGHAFSAGLQMAGEELAEALRIAERIAAQAPQAVVATRLNVLKAIELGQAAAVAESSPPERSTTADLAAEPAPFCGGAFGESGFMADSLPS